MIGIVACSMCKNQRFGRSAYGILERMKGGKKARGFTVMETLIVLAVTGGLFLAVAATLSGRQQRTQFEQAINDVRSQIQQVVNDVGTGFYPSLANFRCTAGASGPVIVSGSIDQGENAGCIFMGKVIQFRVNGTDPEEYRIYSTAGLQRTTTGDEVATYAQARPRVLSPSTSSPSVPDITEKKKLQFGLTTLWMRNGAANIGAVGFINKLATYSSGSIVSGAQQVDVVPVNGTSLNATQLAGAQSINANLQTSTPNPANGVTMCFVSGGTNQSGLITIGSNGRQLSVTLSIRSNRTCT